MSERKNPAEIPDKVLPTDSHDVPNRRDFLKSLFVAGTAGSALLSGCAGILTDIQCSLTSVNSEGSLCAERKVKKLFEGIEIRGTREFIRNTEKALYLLFSNSNSFLEVKRYLGRIQQSKSSGMNISGKLPTAEIGEKTFKSSSIWYASSIAHETYHSLLFHQGGKKLNGDGWTGTVAEQECIAFQLQVLKELSADKYLIEYVIEQKAAPKFHLINKVDQDW